MSIITNLETCLAADCMADRGGRPNPQCPECKGTGKHERKDKLTKEEFVRFWTIGSNLNTRQYMGVLGKDIFPISCSGCGDEKCRGWQMAKRKGT